jgi:hypothetical protein
MVAPRGNRDLLGDVTGDGFQMPVLVKILFLCLKKKPMSYAEMWKAREMRRIPRRFRGSTNFSWRFSNAKRFDRFFSWLERACSKAIYSAA